jgi:hypothetical protein
MIKLTEQRGITPYKWVHPDEEPEVRANSLLAGIGRRAP